MTPERKEKEKDKALQRFFDFSLSVDNEYDLRRKINLRTSRMTNVEKLLIWYEVLRSQKFIGCARYARNRAMDLKYS